MIVPDRVKAFAVQEWSGDRGQKLVPPEWWERALKGLASKQITVILAVRQNGKSSFASVVAADQLYHVPDSYTLYVANSERQASAIVRQKIAGPVRRNRRLRGDTRVSANRVEVKALGSTLEIVPSAEASVPGRSVDLLVLDEARDMDDSLLVRLLPSVLGVGGRVLIVTSPGAPRGLVFELVNNPTADVCVVWLHELTNPYASRDHVRAVSKFAHLFEALYRREYEAEFTTLGDAYMTRELLDLCIDPELRNRGGSELPCYGFMDLARKRDLSSVAVVECTRKKDEPDVLTCVHLQTWNPRDFPSGETDFGVIRAALEDLFKRFAFRRFGIDDRHEAAELMQWTKRKSWAGKVEAIAADVEMNMTAWGALASRVSEEKIRLPAHERLKAELLNLRVEEVGGLGKWRVADAKRKYHRDLSLSLAFAVMMADVNRSTAAGARCGFIPKPDEDGWIEHDEKHAFESNCGFGVGDDASGSVSRLMEMDF